MTDLPALAEALLREARKAGAEAADALAMRSASSSIAVRRGALEQAEASESVDFGLRVLIGKRQACVSASDPRSDVLSTLAERAVAMAKAAPEDPWCGLPDPDLLGPPPDVDLALTDPAGAAAPADLQTLAQAGEAAALAVAGVAQVDSAEAGAARTELALAATNGFRGGWARHDASLVVSAVAGEGTGMETGYDYASRRRLADLPDPNAVGRRAAARAVAALGARKAPQGAAAVIFDARVAPSLLRHLLGAANGAAVARGASWLKDRMGEPVLPDWATVAIDPLIPGAPGSRPFDGEGLPARARPLVENGVLARWLLDGAAARQLGLPPQAAGDARRGVGGPPGPGVSNARLSVGGQSQAALMAQAGRGLLVTTMLGSSVNPTTGAYSRGAGGFWFENGEIVHPVAEATIAGALPEFLRRMTPADDPDLSLAVAAPSLLVEGLVVA